MARRQILRSNVVSNNKPNKHNEHNKPNKLFKLWFVLPGEGTRFGFFLFDSREKSAYTPIRKSRLLTTRKTPYPASLRRLTFWEIAIEITLQGSIKEGQPLFMMSE